MGTSTAAWKLLQANMSPSLPPSISLSRVYRARRSTKQSLRTRSGDRALYYKHTFAPHFSKPLAFKLEEWKERRTTSVASIHNGTITIRSFHFASFKPVRLRADFRSKKIWKIAREEYRTRKKKRIDVADIINANHFSKACLIFKPR